MEVLKKLVGRRNMVGDDESPYRMQTEGCNNKAPAGTTVGVTTPTPTATSTKFDDDVTFMTLSKAMLFRFEKEGLSKRDAINATLLNSEEKHSFLQSLDLRHALMYVTHEESTDDKQMNEIIVNVHTAFGPSLRSMWRESIIPLEDITTTQQKQHDQRRQQHKTSSVQSPKRRHFDIWKTPRMLHSPIRTTTNTYSNKTATTSTITPSPEGTTTVGTSSAQSKSSGKQRRQRFHPDSDQPRFRSRIRLDFKFSGSSTPVQCLQLDGIMQPAGDGSYAPPSPIDSSVRGQTVVRKLVM